MKYDFDSIIDRRGMDAAAVDGIGCGIAGAPSAPSEGFDAIPMWVADMNFRTAPSISEAIIERAKHPLYGYFFPTNEYYQSIIDWQNQRNGVTDLIPENIGYQNGVLGGVVSGLNVLCPRGANVLLHSPTYTGFTAALKNNGYSIVLSPLVKDGENVYRMDFDDMENKIVRNKIHAAVFCSPHNPTGRVWERRELEQAFELFRKHDVYVISDEIWSDILLNGHRHIPSQSVNEDARMRTVAIYAPTKTFNLAGLVGSYDIIYNPRLRDLMNKEASLSHYNMQNVLSMHALIGAYSRDGSEWVDELCEVLSGNMNYACDFIEKNFDGVEISRPEGTYMLFADCEKWCRAHGRNLDELFTSGCSVGVSWQDGRPFHGEYSIRMNLALPFSRVQEAFSRLDRYVFNAV